MATFGAMVGLSDPMEDYPGYWLKSYEQGTTNPLAMATDSTGGTTAAKFEISSGGTVPIGFLKTAGDAIVQPWVDEAYDAYLIPTEAEADANDLSNAIQIADNALPAEVAGETLDTALRADLADNTDPAKGSALVGHNLDGLTGVDAFAWNVRDAINGLYNRRVYLNDPRFGITGDGVTDDTAGIQAAVDYLATVGLEGGGEVIVPVPDVAYLVTETIHVPWNITVKGVSGNSATFKVDAGFVGTNDYVFSFNSVAAGPNPANPQNAAWDVPFPGLATGKIEDIDIDNSDGPITTRGIFAAGGFEANNLKQNGLANHITTSGDYTDHVNIRRCQSRVPPSGSDYMYKLQLTGDAVSVTDITNGSGAVNTVQVIGCLGGHMRGVIGGNVLVDRCDAFTIENFHSETGIVEVLDSNAIIKDSWIKCDYDNLVGIDINTSTDQRFNVAVENTSFVYYLAATESGFLQDDIRMGDNCTLTIKNSGKRIFESGAYGTGERSGLYIVDGSNVGIDDFNDYSYLMSQDGFIEQNHKVRGNNNVVDLGSGTLNLLGGATGLSGKVVWNKATDTYFYEAIYLYDTGRLIGKASGSGEKSFALTNGGNGMLLQVETSAAWSSNVMCRVYRGTSTGSYDEFVDIPMTSTKYLFDKGDNISGFSWISRTPAGVDLNETAESLRWDGDKITAYRAGTPAFGNWIHGDTVVFPSPSAGGTSEERCVVAGTPGTWKGLILEA